MTYTQKDVGTSNPTGDAFPVVEKKETLMNQPKGGKIVELVKDGVSQRSNESERSNNSINRARHRTSWLPRKIERPSTLALAVITVYPNQSITDVVIKELQDRAQRPRPSGQKTTTLIITAASRSDESNVPSLHNDPGILQPRTTQPGEDTSPSIEQPVKESRLTAGLSNQPPAPERQSRLSFLKKRFTRTKDKKARSHSIERSSGIDEHRYLSPATSPMGGSSGGSMTSVDSGAPNTPVPAPSPKKKFGGSLRKLFHLKKRSSSKSREKPSSASDRHMNILTDLEKNYQNSQYDRLSIERDDQSKSSMEQELTPHRRVITPSTSNYNNNFDGNDTLEQSVEDHNRNFFPDDDKRHSLPYKKSPKMTI